MKVTLQNTWFDGTVLWDRGTFEMDESVRDKLPPTAIISEEEKADEKPKGKSKLEL